MVQMPANKSHDPPLEPVSTGNSNWKDSIGLSYSAPAFIICFAFVLMFYRMKAIGLMGWDSYPIIVASRVQTLGDIAGTFTERFMNQRYTDDFYRPIVNLSFALDYALWGLNSIGYQLTGVLLFALSAISLFALLRRLTKKGAFIAPLAMLLFFLFHPAYREILPVPPRRHEFLCCIFMALALWRQLSPKILKGSGLSIGAAIFTMLAIGSKETGLVIPALVFLFVLLYSPHSKLKRRFLQSIIASAPHFLAAGIMVAVRLLVLGKFVGHGKMLAVENFTAFPKTLFMMLKKILLLPPSVPWGTLTSWIITAALVLFAVGALLLIPRWRRTSGDNGSPGKDLLRSGAAALLWILIVALVYAASGRSMRLFHQWYLLLPVAGMAMFIGSLSEGLLLAIRKGTTAARSAAALLLLLIIFLLGQLAVYSPMVYHYDEWERATEAGREFLTHLRETIEETSPGTVIDAPPVPTRVALKSHAPLVRGVHILADYSIQAWADLSFPHRNIRVVKAPASKEVKAEPDEIVVVLSKLKEGFH